MERTSFSSRRARLRRGLAPRVIAGGAAFILSLVTGSAAPVQAQAPVPATSADCSPKDGLSFVCGLVSVEDIVAAPGRRWLIGSSFKRDKAGLYVIDAKTRTAKAAALSIAPNAGAAPFEGCAAPDLQHMNTHGIELRPGKNGVHTIYVINQEGRQSIEIRWIVFVP